MNEINVTFNNPEGMNAETAQKAFSLLVSKLVAKLGSEQTLSKLEIAAREWGYYSGYSLEVTGNDFEFTHVSMIGE